MSIKVLWVDDEYDSPQLQDLADNLQEKGVVLISVKSAHKAQQIIQEQGKEIDVILRDLNILENENDTNEHNAHGIGLSRFLDGLDYYIPQIFFTGQGEREQADAILIKNIVNENPVYFKYKSEDVLNLSDYLFKAARSGVKYRLKKKFPGIFEMHKWGFYDENHLSPYVTFLENGSVGFSQMIFYRNLQERLCICFERAGLLPKGLYTGIKDGAQVIKFLKGDEITISTGIKVKVKKEYVISHHIANAMNYSYHMASLALHEPDETYGGLELKKAGLDFENQSYALLMLWEDTSKYFIYWMSKVVNKEYYLQTGEERLERIDLYSVSDGSNPNGFAKDKNNKTYFISSRLMTEGIGVGVTLKVTFKLSPKNASTDFAVTEIVELVI